MGHRWYAGLLVYTTCRACRERFRSFRAHALELHIMVVEEVAEISLAEGHPVSDSLSNTAPTVGDPVEKIVLTVLWAVFFPTEYAIVVEHAGGGIPV